MDRRVIFLIIVIFVFIITGTTTTLCLKWSDLTEAEGCDGSIHSFYHPFLQASFMFLGEFYCIIVFYVLYFYFKCKGNGKEDTNFITKGNRKFNAFILAPAAALDMTANTINFIGLTMTYASSFQMFRGAIIVFVGIFSYIFLGRRLKVSEIIGMALVLCGLTIVGLTDFFLSVTTEEKSPTTVILGDLLILVAQVFGAGHMVYEQKFCNQLDIPAMQAAGLEGVFGLIFTGILNTVYYFIYVGEKFGGHNPRHVIEDVVDAFIQITNEPILIIAILIYTAATCIYNFTGITISKELSALTRKVIDNFRIILIWVVAIICFGQDFIWPTINGFLVLLYGLFLYSGCSIFGNTRKRIHLVPGLDDD